MDASQTIALLSEQIRQSPRPIDPWLKLVRALVSAGMSSVAVSVLEQRHGIGADSLSTLYDALGPMIVDNDVSARSFLGSVPQNHVFQPVVTALRGWFAVMDEKADDAVLLLRNAFRMVPQIKAFAENDTAFVQRVYQLLANQVEQLVTSDEMAQYDVLEPPVGIEFEGTIPPDATLLVAAAADSRYLVKFGESYARSFESFADETMALNLHVIDPDPAAEECLRRIAGRVKNLTISRERGRVLGKRKVYFACNRFLIAPELLGHAKSPVLFTDIDVAFLRPISETVRIAQDADVALFETAHCAPQLRCDAALVQFSPTPGTEFFLRILRRYLAEKLRTDADWMLDQAALWSVTRAYADSGRFRYLDLSFAHGANQNTFIAKYQDDGAKREMRNSNG